MNFGKLNNIDLRSQWPSEPRDFTPWLADNLEELDSKLLLGLHEPQKEQPAGIGFVDIMAIDSDSQKVIIENQLTPADYEHLGKCLVYAAGLDAKTIIWIASDFKDDFIQTVNWINNNTGDDVDVYAVKLELFSIDNSFPAFRFNIVCRPDFGQKVVSKELSQQQNEQLAFWEDFRTKIINAGGINSGLSTPRPTSSYDIYLGIGGLRIQCRFNSWNNTGTVCAYVSNTKTETYVPLLKQKQSVIEQKIGGNMVWNEEDRTDKTLRYEMDFSVRSKEENIDDMVKCTVQLYHILKSIDTL